MLEYWAVVCKAGGTYPAHTIRYVKPELGLWFGREFKGGRPTLRR